MERSKLEQALWLIKREMKHRWNNTSMVRERKKHFWRASIELCGSVKKKGKNGMEREARLCAASFGPRLEISGSFGWGVVWLPSMLE